MRTLNIWNQDVATTFTDLTNLIPIRTLLGSLPVFLLNQRPSRHSQNSGVMLRMNCLMKHKHMRAQRGRWCFSFLFLLESV